MIDVQPYIDKLEALKKFISKRVDFKIELMYPESSFMQMVARKHLVHGDKILQTFEQYYKSLKLKQ
jgi:hypothetical protein